jgi:hypothetical protein
MNVPPGDPPINLLLAERERRKRRKAAQDHQIEMARLSRDPVEWIHRNFFIPEKINAVAQVGDDPGQHPRAINLHPYQIAALREAYKIDAEGKFIYSVVVWSDIKKSAKSSIAAAVAL